MIIIIVIIILITMRKKIIIKSLAYIYVAFAPLMRISKGIWYEMLDLTSILKATITVIKKKKTILSWARYKLVTVRLYLRLCSQGYPRKLPKKTNIILLSVRLEISKICSPKVSRGATSISFEAYYEKVKKKTHLCKIIPW